MDLTEALRSNPSVRDFTDEPVSDAEVAALLEVAASRRAAATGSPGMWR